MKRNQEYNDRRDGEGRSGGRRDDARPYNAGARSFDRSNDRRDDNRPRRFDNDRRDDRNTEPRPRNFDRDRNDSPRAFDRNDGPRRPFSRDDRNTDRKPFERKPFNQDRNERTQGDRNDGPRPRTFDRDRDNDRPRSFDRDRNDRDDRNTGPRTRSFDRNEGDRERKPFRRDDNPRGERTYGDRNAESRPQRTFDRDGERKPFERKPFNRENNDRPSYGDRDRNAGPHPRKPFSRDERTNDRDDRPRSPRSFDRNDGPRKPFSRDDRRDNRFDSRRNDDFRNDRNDSPRPRSFDRDRRDSNDEQDGKPQFDRRVGRFERAPNYNLDKMKENLPWSKKVAKNLQRESDPNSIRLNRYIANAGICSRREADELIGKGDVQVNGTVVTEMGYRVKPGDVVKYGNKVLNPEKMVYVLLNKPKDVITTTEDPEERNTVMDMVADAGPFRLYPVGRLDRNTTGLLLMTNDGELASKLTHPSNNVKKVYQVEIDKPITEEHFEAIRNGLELEDGFIKPDDLAIVTPDAQVVGVEIHSGRNRIVRRMFESLGYEVTKLDRTVFAGLTKKELPRGKWRFLEPKEVVKLKYLM
jgi:23S rRNA pseudouridine2605 synthase